MAYRREFHRKSIRLAGYDYASPGGYFITIITHQREPLFGQIINGQMTLSAVGEIAKDEWINSRARRTNLTIHEEELVIMPNHLHGIIWIGAVGEHYPPTPLVTTTPAVEEPSLKRDPSTLGSIIAGYKMKVTSRAISELGMAGIWHRNYYEHILRNADELVRVREYIRQNPLRWEEDALF